MSYFWNLIISVDQLANTVLDGYPDETLSSRAYRMKVQGKWFGWTADVLDGFLGPGHCQQSYKAMRTRVTMSPLLRDPSVKKP